MEQLELRNQLTEADLDFIVDEAAPGAKDRGKIKRFINEDDAFRKGLVGDEKVFRRVTADENIMMKISPALFFEVLLRKTFREMASSTHTIEQAGSQTIAVFDSNEIAGLLTREPVLSYLAVMLSSFTRIESYAVPIRLQKGIWRKIRFNNMDIDSLSSFCGSLPEESRFGFYKRIADVCLFTVGMFPEHASFSYGYPESRNSRPRVAGRMDRGIGDYEEEGKRFYSLAAQHASIRGSEAAGVFSLLGENFNAARKPLTFIAQHYLRYQKQRLFAF